MPLPEKFEMFLKYDYAETKDLCSKFLTLVSALLVFSLTFSEKIIGYPSAQRWSKSFILVTWCLMLAAIITCGIGLTIDVLAAGQARYGSDNYVPLSQSAYRWILVAAFSFSASLITLIIAGAISVLSKK